MAKKYDINAGFNPFDGLPDISKCRAQPSGIADLAYCLMTSHPQCGYAEPLHDKVFCFHPRRQEIIAKTD
jgi:hypothetical protein